MLTSYLTQHVFAIVHASDISATRRAGQSLADQLGFDETAAGRLAIIITEAATNILKHAKEGTVLLTPFQFGEMRRIGVLALDQGPGIANLHLSLLDGISTAGTSGNGLGAMRRLADDFDAYSQPGKGSVFYMSVNGPGAGTAEPVAFGAVCVPKIGEENCGDAWTLVFNPHSATFLCVDGLGHGEDAAEAAQAAVAVLTERPALQPKALIEQAHLYLRGTRGAALFAAEFVAETDELHYAGIGNISACLVDYESRKQLMSHNGIVGHNMRRIQQLSVRWPHETLYVMHSDGLSTQWSINPYPGLYACHPAVIAGVLYRDYVRGRDDVTVFVARRNRDR